MNGRMDKDSEIKAELRIGTAGWSYKDWEGVFYPEAMPSKADRLEYLSRYFDFVEVNNTFYRPPKPEYALKWLKSVEGNPDFRFAAKLYRKFTHEGAEAWKKSDVRQFSRGIEPLYEAGALGALLVQFSWGFRDTEGGRDHLLKLADEFGKYPLVLEVRHASWEARDALEFMKDAGYNLATIDQPVSRGGVSSSAHLTGEIGYIRLHGRNARAWFDKKAGRDEKFDYMYEGSELDEWVKKSRLLGKKAKKLFISANNHFRAQAAANALQLAAALKNMKLEMPVELVEKYPDLKRISQS